MIRFLRVFFENNLGIGMRDGLMLNAREISIQKEGGTFYPISDLSNNLLVQ